MTRRGQVNGATIGTRQADACPVLTLPHVPLVPRSALGAQVCHGPASDKETGQGTERGRQKNEGDIQM